MTLLQRSPPLPQFKVSQPTFLTEESIPSKDTNGYTFLSKSGPSCLLRPVASSQRCTALRFNWIHQGWAFVRLVTDLALRCLSDNSSSKRITNLLKLQLDFAWGSSIVLVSVVCRRPSGALLLAYSQWTITTQRIRKRSFPVGHLYPESIDYLPSEFHDPEDSKTHLIAATELNFSRCLVPSCPDALLMLIFRSVGLLTCGEPDGQLLRSTMT